MSTAEDAAVSGIPAITDRATSVTKERTFVGHPRGLSTFFFTEMWERFSYYGMRAILMLYMTKSFAEGGLGFDEKYAGIIYGTYVEAQPAFGKRLRHIE